MNCQNEIGLTPVADLDPVDLRGFCDDTIRPVESDDAEPAEEEAPDGFDETIHCEMLSVLADKFIVDASTLTGFLTPAVRGDLENLIEQLVDRCFRLGADYGTREMLVAVADR